MIIWIVNPFDGLPGETSRPGRYWAIAELLSCRGHEVTWWSSSFSHGFKTRRTLGPIGINSFSVNLVDACPYDRNISLARVANHRQFANRFYELANRELCERSELRPDRIVVSMPPISPANAAIRLRDRWGGKVIVDIQDAWPETFHRLIPGKGKLHDCLSRLVLSPWYSLVRQAYTNADAITAVAQTYVDLSGARERGQPSCVVYLGAPFEQLDIPIGTEKKAGSPFTFVYLGSMSMNYDLETVLEAVALLRYAKHCFRVVFAGTGPHEERLRNLSKELKLESIVEFAGYLEYDHVVSLLRKCHCALNPIIPECWCAMPNKVSDYFGAGLPVINSIPGELSELIRMNDAGAYYQARNAESLAAIMTKYLTRPEIAERQSPNARRVGCDLFKRETTYVAFAQFIEEL